MFVTTTGSDSSATGFTTVALVAAFLLTTLLFIGALVLFSGTVLFGLRDLRAISNDLFLVTKALEPGLGGGVGGGGAP